MAGDEGIVDGGFLRFLLPAVKEAPGPGAACSPPARLAPPHRLVAPPLPLPRPQLRPDERLFIVPPTRPSWIPPPRLPAPRPAFPAGVEPRRRCAGRFGGRDGPVGRKVGAFVGNGGYGGFVRRKVGGGHVGAASGGEARRTAVAARKEKKKVWVAVEKKGENGSELDDQEAASRGYAGGDEATRAARKEKKKVWVAVEKKGENGSELEDQAAASGGYAGGDEAEGSLEAEERSEPDDDDDDLLGEELEESLVIAGDDNDDDLLGEELEKSLVIAGDDDDDARREPSREHLVPRSNAAPPCPPSRMRKRQAERRHDIGAFASGFLSLYDSIKPSEEQRSKQRQLIDSLAKLVTKEWPNAQLHLYGSSANSFGTSHSDVDLCLEIEIGATDTAADALLRLAEVLRADDFDGVEAITTARVPIVRTLDPESGFSCDICINNLFAVANTKLLRDYAQIDGRLLQLASIVKHWAKLRGVNETYRGTLSSYAYVLMCISFLQLQEPKILPCLQAMEPTYTMVVDGTECAFFDKVDHLHDFGADNKESIAELLWAFFHYWAFHHDYRNDVISVRTGKIISKKEKNWTTRIGNDRHLMCIEDPFETSHDLGRGVDRRTGRRSESSGRSLSELLEYCSMIIILARLFSSPTIINLDQLKVPENSDDVSAKFGRGDSDNIMFETK